MTTNLVPKQAMSLNKCLRSDVYLDDRAVQATMSSFSDDFYRSHFSWKMNFIGLVLKSIMSLVD